MAGEHVAVVGAGPQQLDGVFDLTVTAEQAEVTSTKIVVRYPSFGVTLSDERTSGRVSAGTRKLGMLDDHAAIPAAEPVEAIYRHTATGIHRQSVVHGFTAAVSALVLDTTGGPGLITATMAVQSDEEFVGLRAIDRTDQPEGSFTPAPPGLVATFSNGQKTPIVYYDVRGRPLVIDAEPMSRELGLALADTDLIGIHGAPHGDTTVADDA